MSTTPPAPVLDLPDIQGIIVRGYAELQKSAFLLLDFADSTAFRKWLTSVVPQVADGVSDKARRTALHVALTREGVALAGVPVTEDAGFPREFVEGMNDPVRGKILGDLDDDAPDKWEWGGTAGPQFKAILLLYAGTTEQLSAVQQAAMVMVSQHGGIVARALPCGEMVGSREHFGFHDGISQPTIAGLGRHDDAANVLEAGEFILGYPDAYGALPVSPSVRHNDATRDIGRNGTFLVVRQLEQLVPEFWTSVKGMVVASGAAPTPEACIHLAARMVGRWPGGAPLVKYPDGDVPAAADDNAFAYRAADADGIKCPFGAHIRRSNPRDGLAGTPEDSLDVSRHHRLLRRGRSYGPPLAESLDPVDLMQRRADGAARGLLFICCNTTIARQFEFVQQTWINNPKFAGLYNDADPLVSTPGSEPSGFTVPASPVREYHDNVPPFIRVRGGAYFFLPSITALRYLGAPPALLRPVEGMLRS